MAANSDRRTVAGRARSVTGVVANDDQRQVPRVLPDSLSTREQKPAQPSRDRLIAAASKFFLNGSYHSVGTADICAEASVNKGSFYHFFPSKTDLLIEVIDVRITAVEQMIAAIAQSDAQPARKILQLFDLPLSETGDAAAAAGTSGFFLGNLVLELASLNPSVQSAAERAFQRWTASIERIVLEFLAVEDIKGLDTSGAAEAILGLLQGGAVVAAAYNDPRKLRAFGHIAISLLRAEKSG